EGPTSSFEWAVSAVASIAMHLRRDGYKIRLVTGAGVDLTPTDHDGEAALLDCLAEATVNGSQDLTPLVERVRRGSGGLIIAGLGSLGPNEAQPLSALRSAGTMCLSFPINSPTWLNLPEQARQAADADHEAAAMTLLRSGWRVVGVQ